MADKPILFSGPMVRALLAGTKTQTRRTLNPQPELLSTGLYHVFNRAGGLVGVPEDAVGVAAVDYLRIQKGDRLWVRESIDRASQKGDDEIGYKADWPGDARGLGWRPSIHMPRWASRLTLTVTDVRVERVQDCSEADALAEGMTQATADAILSPEELVVYATTHIVAPQARGRILYETIWDQINGEGAWASNPWVAAYNFTVEHGNIDQVKP